MSVTYTSLRSTPDGLLTLGIRCPMCRIQHVVTVPREGYYRWREDDVLMGLAMPEVHAADREKLISGLCERCQKAIFDTEEEE